jgi:transcriptional regulator with XRE-family HTH domain
MQKPTADTPTADNPAEVRDFLTTRRAKITPDQAGLPAYGGNRRVAGLRREEVAMLAGVSVDYYTRLERGNLRGASDAVLDALVRALQLDEAETAYLFDLARSANASPVSAAKRAPAPQVRPSIQRLLDSITTAPAAVRNGRFDYLAANRLGRALYAPLYEHAARDAVAPNSARFTFLDPRARDFYVDWDRATRDVVAFLRSEAGRNPYDRALTDLIGELSTRSELFRTLWAAHNVRFHRSGTKSLNHPVVGRLDLSFEGLELPTDPGLTLLTYNAEAGTPGADGLSMLASWAATLDTATSSRSTT